MASRSGWLPALLAAALLPSFASVARAQDEILINDDRLPRSQFAPRPARGLNGTLVVTWADGRTGPDDNPDCDIPRHSGPR